MAELCIRWEKILACTETERRSMLPLVETLVKASKDTRCRGIIGLQNFQETLEDPFQIMAIQMVVNAYMPDLITAILNQFIQSSELTNAKYLKYILFAVFALTEQRGVTPIQMELLLKSLLGIGSLGDVRAIRW